MDDLSGQQIKGYELRERIGTGGFGAVYKAQQSTVNREVAIKIILPHFSNHPDFIRRFENEAQLVARLEHLHIVPLYDYWRDPDGAYLVMRWLRGGSLRDSLQKGPLTPEMAVAIIDQIAAALSAAHRSHVIHRDLKPGNILLDEDGNAYLADFGIAKDVSLKGNITEPDAIVGSPDYLAPEQARGEIVTPATDIYSLGVVLYELLAGEHPFPNLNSIERLYKHLNEPLPLLSNLPDDIRSTVNEVIQKATAKNPLDRYADVLDMAAAFHSAANTSSATNVVEGLTLREQDILRLIIAGRSNKEIAEELFIALNTVKWYVTQIYQKLGVRTRVQAIVRARELNLIGNTQSGVIIVQDTKTVVPTDDFQPKNPYKGLRSFQSADNQDFFGREKLIERLIKRMGEVNPQNITKIASLDSEMGRFLAVVGPSGSGKSSLVKAGLIPALWRGDLPGSEKWFVVEMLPGSHPLDELEVALTRVAANQSGNLHEQLERDERGLVRAAQLILPNDGTEIVIVIDQFEEVFTLVKDEPERAHFLELIQGAVSDPRSRVRIVVTLRADFYDRPLHYEGIGELFRSHIEAILPLTAEGLERSISQPAQQVGVQFEPGLVAKIISEVNYQPGALPLLQYALTELFELRKGRLLTLEAYQSIGGTIGALAKRVDELYLSMSAAGQGATQQMFMRLVTLGEGVEDTRRRVARSELLDITAEPDIMDEVIDTYSEYRLLSLDNDPNTRTPTVEVAHEAILREWERLRGWLNDSREDIKLQRQLANATDEWEQSDRELSFLLRGSRLSTLAKWASETQLALTENERHYLRESLDEQHQQQVAEVERQTRVKALEQRAVRFLRILVVVLLLAVLGALVLTGLAVTNANQAQDNAQSANNAKATSDVNLQHSEALRLASAANVLLPGAENNAELAALLAIRSLKQFYNPQADAALTQATSLLYTVHLFPIGKLARVSPDGRYVLSSNDELNAITLYDRASGQKLKDFDTGKYTKVEFSPDSDHIAIANQDHTITLQNIATDQKTVLEGHHSTIIRFRFSSDSKYVLSTSDDGEVNLWDIQMRTKLHTFNANFSISLAFFSPDNSSIFVVGDNEGTVDVWDAISYQRLYTLNNVYNYTIENGISYFAFSLNRRTFFIADSNGLGFGKVSEIDLRSGQRLRSLQLGGDSFISNVTISPDESKLLVANLDGTAHLIDLASGTELYRIKGHSGALNQAVFSPNGQMILTVGKDGIAILWDVTTGNELGRFTGHRKEIFAAGFVPDSSQFFTLSLDDTVRFWNATLNRARVFTMPNAGQISSVSFSPNSHELVTAGQGDINRIWNIDTGENIATFAIMNDRFSTLGQLSRDSTMLLGCTNAVRVWDRNSKQILRTFSTDFRSNDQICAMANWSHDGRFIFETTNGGDAYLWELASGQKIQEFHGHSAQTLGVGFSPDDKYVATASDDKTARIWNLSTGKEIHQFQEDEAVSDIKFSPDGKYVVTTVRSEKVRLWDTNTWQELKEYIGGHDIVSIAFSPDGKELIGGDFDGTVLVWDTNGGKELRRFANLEGGVVAVNFSPDGRLIAAGLSNGKALVWDNSVSDSIAYACNHIFTDFTQDDRTRFGIIDNDPTCPQFSTSATVSVTTTSTPSQFIPVWTPIFTPTPLPTTDRGHISIGTNRGEITSVDTDIWHYQGYEGEIITIEVNADHPANTATDRTNLFDPIVVIKSPDGDIIGQNDDKEYATFTDSLIQDLTLPSDGLYTIEVASVLPITSGAYTLVISSKLKAESTAAP